LSLLAAAVAVLTEQLVLVAVVQAVTELAL
jgi:hypothetical protein